MFSSFISTLGFSPSKAKDTPNTETHSPGSTWAGSSPVDGDGQDPNAMPEYKTNSTGMPDYEYPVFVKNTFIDGPGGPPESLVDFMPPRQAQSCPTSALYPAPPGLVSSVPPINEEDLTAALEAKELKCEENRDTPEPKAEIADVTTPSVIRPTQWPRTMSGDQLDLLGSVSMATTPERSETLKSVGDVSGYTATPSPSPVRPTMWPRTMSGDALELTLAQENSPSDVILDPSVSSPDCFVNPYLPAPHIPPPMECAPNLMQEQTLPPPMLAPSVGYPQQVHPDDGALVAPVLRLAEVIPEPELGTPEYPTKGSKTHRVGGCKPCAFLHTKGCQNGTECEFCHLCEPGEKKKRQREKRHMQRMGVNLAR